MYTPHMPAPQAHSPSVFCDTGISAADFPVWDQRGPLRLAAFVSAFAVPWALGATQLQAVQHLCHGVSGRGLPQVDNLTKANRDPPACQADLAREGLCQPLGIDGSPGVAMTWGL